MSTEHVREQALGAAGRPSRPPFARKVSEGRLNEITWCTTRGECTMLLGGNRRVGCTIHDKEYTAALKKG